MLHDEVRIGSHVCINDGVVILTASHDVNDPHWRAVTKPVVIDDYAWIATGATILPGVRIGRGAVVGASAPSLFWLSRRHGSEKRTGPRERRGPKAPRP